MKFEFTWAELYRIHLQYDTTSHFDEEDKKLLRKLEDYISQAQAYEETRTSAPKVNQNE